MKKGILTIADICNEEGNMYKLNEMSEIYNLHINFMEYYSLISAIPMNCNHLIKNSQNKP